MALPDLICFFVQIEKIIIGPEIVKQFISIIQNQII